VVEAVLRGMPKAEAARTFGIGISTVKRYVGKAHKERGCVPGEQLWKARRAPLGPAEEVRQWWRRARVRQRKTALVTIPSNQPRMAEKMTIQTSDTVDEPTTQLNST
jgi:transposase